MEEVSSFDTEESLIQTLSGEFIGNDKTKFGTAYHSLIEGDYIFNKEDKSFKVGDFVFTSEQAYPGRSYKAIHQSMVYEVVILKVYETNYGPIQVSGRVDGLEGLFIRDIKTKFRNVNPQEYRDSLQWKFYLDMQELETFYYDVFEVKGFKELPVQAPYTIPESLLIIPHEPIECNAYEGMQARLITELNIFLSYIENRKFHNYLKPALTQNLF